MRRLGAIFKDQRGATVVEYGIILALIFVGMLVGLASMASSTMTLWNTISTAVTSNG